MSGKPAPGLSGISEICLSREGDDEIVDRCHHMAGVTNCHSSRIFFEGHITTTVQSSFDLPVRSANFLETSWSSIRAGQAADNSPRALAWGLGRTIMLSTIKPIQWGPYMIDHQILQTSRSDVFRR